MRTILSQCVASTSIDSAGERLSKAFLDDYAVSMAGKRQPLNQQHDLSRRPVGYAENYRVQPDPASPGEWRLVADVSLDDHVNLDALHGFSISGVEMLRVPDSADAKMLLAYPIYNDEALLRDLALDDRLALGRWIKKAAGDFEWGVLLGSLLAFVVTPIWDDVYKRKIAPRVDQLLNLYLEKLQPKGVRAELLQVVQINEAEVQIRFIPAKAQEAICLRSDAVHAGLQLAVALLQNDNKASSVGVRGLVLFYDEGKSAYCVHRVEYADGSVEHRA